MRFWLHQCPSQISHLLDRARNESFLSTNCTEIHAGVQFYTHRSLWGAPGGGGSRATRTFPHMGSCTRTWPQGNIGPVLADTKIAEWHNSAGGMRQPRAVSSPNESQKCPVAFAVNCDLEPGANLVPPLPGPWQLGALPLGVHSRDEALWSSSEYCPWFSLNGHMNSIISP